MSSKEYLCEKCYYPAQNETEFMNPSTQSITNKCPHCGGTKTTTQKLFNFRLTWDTLNGIGVTQQLQRKIRLWCEVETTRI